MGAALHYREINALRAVITAVERTSAEWKHLYRFEEEFSSQRHGISIIVPVHNGAQELEACSSHCAINRSINLFMRQYSR